MQSLRRLPLVVCAASIALTAMAASASAQSPCTPDASAPECVPETPAPPALDEATPPAAALNHQHLFGVLPNYTTVEQTMDAGRVTAHDKFAMASLNTFDPYVYPFVGFVATLNRTFGPGIHGFVKQYPASLADNAIGNFMTTAVVPSALHQDPRYFERGTGSIAGRIAYAASRSIVTRSDTGGAQLNMSELGGNGIAAGLSNFYYPTADRTVSATLSRWGGQVLWDTLSNEAKEFWPDVRRKLRGD
jgi:hypothetical protein